MLHLLYSEPERTQSFVYCRHRPTWRYLLKWGASQVSRGLTVGGRSMKGQIKIESDRKRIYRVKNRKHLEDDRNINMLCSGHHHFGSSSSHQVFNPCRGLIPSHCWHSESANEKPSNHCWCNRIFFVHITMLQNKSLQTDDIAIEVLTISTRISKLHILHNLKNPQHELNQLSKWT